MLLSFKIDLKRDFAGGVYLSEAPSPPMTPYSSPPCTLYSIRVYNILIHTGKGGGGR